MNIIIIITIISNFSFLTNVRANGFDYNRTVIKIIAAENNSKIITRTSNQTSPDNEADKKAIDTKLSDLLPNALRPTKEFAVAIRPLSILTQKDFFIVEPFTDKDGMIIMLGDNEKADLISANFLGNIDVLFVAENGIIEQIAPNIALSELEEPIRSNRQIRAFIFLKSGMSKKYDIRPGDMVENSAFKVKPLILE